MTSGISISLHYCGGKLKNISLFEKENEEGCCGSKMKSKGCCNEEAAFIKVKDDQHSGNYFSLSNNSSEITLAILPVQLFLVMDESPKYGGKNYHALPVLYEEPLYLKHRVLII